MGVGYPAAFAVVAVSGADGSLSPAAFTTLILTEYVVLLASPVTIKVFADPVVVI